MKYGYNDTDKEIKISIYDLEFSISNIDDRKVDELKNINKDLNSLEKQIEEFLGEGSVEKINEKREKDGYPKMDIKVELAVLGCIFETYANAMSNNTINKIEKSITSINDRISNIGNRNQRRYNKRHNNYRRY